MTPRIYTMKRRAEEAAETRRRIVAAAYELHGKHGVAGTSIRDIAELAGVGLGTVHHHFPSYDDVIRACGAHTWETCRPPTAEVLASIRGPRERITVLVSELCALYERMPFFDRIRADRARFAPLAEAFAGEEENRRGMIAAAFRGLRPGRALHAVVFALLDFSTYDHLRKAGLSQKQAVSELTSIVLSRANIS